MAIPSATTIQTASPIIATTLDGAPFQSSDSVVAPPVFQSVSSFNDVGDDRQGYCTELEERMRLDRSAIRWAESIFKSLVAIPALDMIWHLWSVLRSGRLHEFQSDGYALTMIASGVVILGARAVSFYNMRDLDWSKTQYEQAGCREFESAAKVSEDAETDAEAEFSSAAPFKNPLAGQLKPVAVPRISEQDLAAVREATVYEPSFKRVATHLYSELVDPLGTINNAGTAAGESVTGFAALGALLLQAAARGFVPVP